MTREDECNALVDIWRIYDGNLKTYNLDPPPETIKKFLRGHRSLKTRQAVLFAALAAVKTAERLKRRRNPANPQVPKESAAPHDLPAICRACYFLPEASTGPDRPPPPCLRKHDS